MAGQKGYAEILDYNQSNWKYRARRFMALRVSFDVINCRDGDFGQEEKNLASEFRYSCVLEVEISLARFRPLNSS